MWAQDRKGKIDSCSGKRFLRPYELHFGTCSNFFFHGAKVLTLLIKSSRPTYAEVKFIYILHGHIGFADKSLLIQ